MAGGALCWVTEGQSARTLADRLQASAHLQGSDRLKGSGHLQSSAHLQSSDQSAAPHPIPPSVARA